ncbi:MAG: hypothetical protein KGZ86_01420 [Candidatus Latescibacteria bacterium]|nr:hypothetical protein [Candidatus Latescibacterota bacterium]
MKRLIILLIFADIALAMPSRPGLINNPVFPVGIEIPGPDKLTNRTNLETVTILMQFPDNRADTIQRSPARFDSMLYSSGSYNNQSYRQGSLNDYYLENSYGNYHVQGVIAGNRWFMSSHNYSEYYDGNYMLSTGDDLARDNVQQVD